MYRNWPEICKIVSEAPFFALEVATMILKPQQSETTRSIILAFPELFSDVEVQGPIPLSILKEMSFKTRMMDGVGKEEIEERWNNMGAYIGDDSYESLGIPVFLGDFGGVFSESDLPTACNPILREAKPREVITLRGRPLFVLFKCEEYAEVCPVECVAVNL